MDTKGARGESGFRKDRHADHSVVPTRAIAFKSEIALRPAVQHFHRDPRYVARLFKPAFAAVLRCRYAIAEKTACGSSAATSESIPVRPLVKALPFHGAG